MPIVTIHVKNKANNKDLLDSTKKEIGDSVIFDIEKPPRGPIVSKAPLGIPEIKEALEYIRQLLYADTLVTMAVSGIIGNVAWGAFIKAITPLKKFFTSNNRQKGNAWGLKIEVKRVTDEKREQTFNFYLDNISEGKLFDAIGQIEDKIQSITTTLGSGYIDRLKNIGFKYDVITNEWKMIGAEKFDGDIEAPPSDKSN
ncbi:MAG: hypothetical protein NT077_04790 [Candidatus Taylorbacteria bacterium]|nr:hypothetical protein [Candidatus Taylorbacteria bacterium]